MEVLYSWEFNTEKNRWKNWYIIAISILLWITIWWILTKQYWLSFIVLLLSWVFYFVENNSDDKVKIVISNLWIQVWKNFYEYWKIKNYSYIYVWNIPYFLRLNINKAWLKHIDLKINEKIFLDLQSFLSSYLLEDLDWWKLSFSEKLVEKLKL